MTTGVPPGAHPPFDDTDESTAIVSSADVGGFFGGRFRIDQRLGSGAMGKVLSALDTQTGQLVALKVLHRDRSKDPDVLRRFAREARALSAIAHPAIVGIVASGRAPDGTPWLAMEHLVGTTLKDRIKSGGPMSIAELWPIMKTLAEAMAAAHTAGVVHRDLKPENVFLPERSPPPAKILDFGLSSLSRENERVTKTGEVLGTPRYMAPELLTSSKKPDHRVDVFALGVITFEALTGQSMYTADDLGSLFGQILEGRTRSLRLLRPDLSDTMEALIAQATARDQDERFGSVTAFVTAFGHAAGYRDGPAPPQKSALGALFDDVTTLETDQAPLLDPFSGVALPTKKPSSIPVRSRAPTAFGVAPAGVPFRPQPQPAPPGRVSAPGAPSGSLKPAAAPAASWKNDTQYDPSAGPAAWGHGPTPEAPIARPRLPTPSPQTPASRPRLATPSPMAAPAAPPPAAAGPPGAAAFSSALPVTAPPQYALGSPPAGEPLPARPALGAAAGARLEPAPSSAGASFSSPVAPLAPPLAPAAAGPRAAEPAPPAPALPRPAWLYWALFGVAAVVVMAAAAAGALALRWLISTGRL